LITRTDAPEAPSYYEAGYWRSEDLWQDFEARVAERPDKPALICGEATLTFGELRHAAAALSERLAREGVAPGDVVGLCGRHSIEAVIALMACFHRGVVLALVPPMFSEQQLGALMRQCGARALLGFGGEAAIAKCRDAVEGFALVVPVATDDLPGLLAAPAAAERTPVDPDAMAVVLLSSGTTSTPKGIVHSTNTVRASASPIACS